MRHNLLITLLILITLTCLLSACDYLSDIDDLTDMFFNDKYYTHTTHTWELQTQKAPTCSDAGIQLRCCSVCQYTETKEISPLPHSYTSDVITEAGCTKAGECVYTCSVCDYKYSSVLPLTGHDYGTYTVTQEPTCGGYGIEETTCLKCGDIKTRYTTPTMEHTFVYSETAAASCTENGSINGKCEVCNCLITTIIPAYGHSFDGYTVIQEANCEKVGIQTATCQTCNFVDRIETPALDHEFGEYSVTKIPTCTELGTEEAICKNCGLNDCRELTVEHNYINNVCTNCGSNPFGVVLNIPEAPLTVDYKSSSGKIYTTCKISSIEIKFSQYSNKMISATIILTCEQTFNYHGEDAISPCYIAYKLYDSEGYVVKSGMCSTISISVGEKVKDVSFALYDLDVNESYTLVLTDYVT